MIYYNSFLGVLVVVFVLASNSADGYPKNKAASSSELPEPGVCGSQIAQERIFGGSVTGLDEFPWMVLLEYTVAGVVNLKCGGSLINSRFVLTAAHCIEEGLTKVRLGEYDTRNETDCVNFGGYEDCTKSISVDIETIMTHPNFSVNNGNDIALLKITESVIFTDFIKPICLPVNQLELPKNFYVAGWGQSEKDEESPIKLKVQVPFYEKQECMRSYNLSQSSYYLGDTQICAGGETGKDSCVGDSGGPLMAPIISEKKEVWYQFGVVSYGPTPCGQPRPAVYTQVSDYMPWILEQIKK